MADELVERQGLLQLISPNIQPLEILAVESLFYLPELCAMMPNAHVSVVTTFEEITELKDYPALGIDWCFLDFRKDELPFEQGRFDVVLAEPCLTMSYTPYETLVSISRLLKETGHLITEFRNIRYWHILETLKNGFFHEREERLYAKPEVVRLLNDAMFKEISFAPLKRDGSEEEMAWEALGFENFSHDLATEIWMLKADRSTAAIANLKSLFTPGIRKELSWLLHRIEYDIDREENMERLWSLCRKYAIFGDYLRDFAQEIMTHPDALEHLRHAAKEQGIL